MCVLIIVTQPNNFLMITGINATGEAGNILYVTCNDAMPLSHYFHWLIFLRIEISIFKQTKPERCSHLYLSVDVLQ